MTIFPCPDSMFPLDRRQQEEEKGGNECRTHPEFSMQFSFFSFPEVARDSVARSVVNPSAFPICRCCCWSTTFASETRQGMGLLLLCVAGNEIIDLLLRVPVRASNFLPLLVPSSPEIKCVFVLGPSILSWCWWWNFVIRQLLQHSSPPSPSFMGRATIYPLI